MDRLLAVTGPRVVVIDDLQWLDPSSVGMVDLVIERCADHAMVVLAASRPGPLPGWASHPDVRRMDLTGLDEPETARLATIVARAAVDADGARSIHERTAGNPLFVGETVRAFLEDGTLAWRDGMVALSASSGTRLPITLRAILGARIDALPTRGARRPWRRLGHRHQLPTIGRSRHCSTTPLAADAFEQLAASALVRRTTATAGGSLTPSSTMRRTRVYSRAGGGSSTHAWPIDLERGPEPSTLSQIAAHRVAAGDVSRAIPLLREAAESALALGAVAEAAASGGRRRTWPPQPTQQERTIDRARAAEAVIADSTRFASSWERTSETPAQEAPAIGPS